MITCIHVNLISIIETSCCFVSASHDGAMTESDSAGMLDTFGLIYIALSQKMDAHNIGASGAHVVSVTIDMHMCE